MNIVDNRSSCENKTWYVIAGVREPHEVRRRSVQLQEHVVVPNTSIHDHIWVGPLSGR